ncbi:hypothetical protein JCM4914_08310 [Streptomyces platensis subsp. malvinus]
MALSVHRPILAVFPLPSIISRHGTAPQGERSGRAGAPGARGSIIRRGGLLGDLVGDIQSDDSGRRTDPAVRREGQVTAVVAPPRAPRHLPHSASELEMWITRDYPASLVASSN